MELKRYLEKDSKTALEKIRSLHGDEALIVSTEKVGNKTEIIVGVEELKTADEKASPKINDRPSTDLSNESVDSRVTSRGSQKDPWQFVDQLNNEIIQIKEQIATFSRPEQHSNEPDLVRIDQAVKENGHDLGQIETNFNQSGACMVLGLPGSGKSTVIEKIARAKHRESESTFVHALFRRERRIETSVSITTYAPLTLNSTEQLEVVSNLTTSYDYVFLEVAAQSNEELVEIASNSNFTAPKFVCIPMDYDNENISFLLEGLGSTGAMIVPTRLDLCANLPTKLDLITKSTLKIVGTNTGAN